MQNLIYKIKNRLFRLSKEEKKTKRPSYNELIKYEILKNKNSKLALSFGLVEVQTWFTKIFNSHLIGLEQLSVLKILKHFTDI